MTGLRPAGLRTPVVLVPGLSGDPGRDFALLGPMLARHRHVEQVDLRGVRTPEDIDAAVASSVDRATIAGVAPVLLGVSIGGTAAMRFAAADGARLDRVVAIAAWLQPADALEAFARIWTTLRGERSAALQSVAGALLTSPAGRDRWRPMAETPATDALVALAARLVAGDVSRLAVPALVIGGDADTVATTRAARLLAAAADAELRLVAGGHDLLVERPVEVLAHLTAFADVATVHTRVDSRATTRP